MSQRTVCAVYGDASWKQWLDASPRFDRLAFTDGLQGPPVLDAGEGRLTLSGPSLHMLASVNAKQREGLETSDEVIARFFPDAGDRQRALHWLTVIMIELLHPGRLAIEPDDLEWAMRELLLRGYLWKALRRSSVLKQRPT